MSRKEATRVDNIRHFAMMISLIGQRSLLHRDAYFCIQPHTDWLLFYVSSFRYWNSAFRSFIPPALLYELGTRTILPDHPEFSGCDGFPRLLRDHPNRRIVRVNR